MRKPDTSLLTDGRHNTRLRLEQWLKNPLCEANAISAVTGYPMRSVAAAEGVNESGYGQSPFAIARGLAFERHVLESGGERILEVMRREAFLDAGASGMIDLRLRMSGGPCSDLNEAINRSAEILRAYADPAPRRRPTAALIAGLTLEMPGNAILPDPRLIVDITVARTIHDRVEFSVGEVKTYPDRAGYTDSDQLSTARAQMGIYVHALQRTATVLSISDRILIAKHGFLVLTRPGSGRVSVRLGEDLRYQAARAERGLEVLGRVADDFVREHGHKTEEAASLVREAPTQYGESCISFCERAPVCHRKALECSNPAALGDDMARFLGNVSIDRALAILAGEEPMGASEMELLGRIRRGTSA